MVMATGFARRGAPVRPSGSVRCHAMVGKMVVHA